MHWQSLSNELSNPKVVRSPRDSNRNQANSFVTKKPKAQQVVQLCRSTKRVTTASATQLVLKDESKPNNILSATRNIEFGKYNNDRR